MESLHPQSDQHLREILENAPEAFILLGADGDVVFWNERARKLFGYSHGDIRELGFNGLCDDTEAINGEWLPVSSPGLEAQQRRCRHAHGHVLDVEFSISQMNGGDSQKHVAIIARDITEKKQTERRLAVQFAVTNALATSERLETAANSILESIGTLAEWDHADFWLCNSKELHRAASWTSKSISHHSDSSMDDVVKHACDRREALWIADIQSPNGSSHEDAYIAGRGTLESGDKPSPTFETDESNRHFHNEQHAQFHSCCAVPLTLGSDVLAVIALYSGHRRPAEIALLELLTTTGSQIAQFIERKRVEDENRTLLERERKIREEAEAGRQRFAFLAEASETLSSSLDFQTTLAAIAHQAVPKLGDWCAVDMKAGEGVERLAVAHVDPAKIEWVLEIQRRYPEDPNSPNGLYEVLRTGNPLFMPVIPQELLRAGAIDEEHWEIIETLGLVSAMVVPIIVKEKGTVGAITFVAAESGKHYSTEDFDMAMELARRAAIAIENAGLYRDVRASEELLATTLRSIGDAVIATDAEGNVNFLNPVAEELTGWPIADARGHSLSEVFNIVNEQTRLPVESPVDKVLRTGTIVGLANHTVLLARNGNEVPIDDSAAPIRNSEGGIHGVVMVFRDITERKQAEEERAALNMQMEEQRIRLQNVVTSVPGLVWEAWGEPGSPDQHIDYINDFTIPMLGYTAEEWTTTPNFWKLITHPDDREKSVEFANHTFFSKGAGTQQMRWIRKDGEVIWVETHSVAIRDENGSPRGMRGVTMDITARKMIEMELQEETQTLEGLNAIGRLIAAELNLDRLVQAVTDAATSLTGAAFGAFFYNVIDASGGPSYMLYTLSGVPQEEFKDFPMPRATEMFGPTFRGEGVIRVDDVRTDPRYGKNSPHYGIPKGHLPVVSYLAVSVVLRSGEVIGGLFFGHPESGVFTERHERIVTGLASQAAIAMDNARLYDAAQREIEERKKTEHELVRAKEQAETANRAKDQFLAVLSHELRTPLTPVLAMTHLLESDPILQGEHKPIIEMIHRNVELEARLIDDLLDLTRITRGKLSLQLESVDAHSLVSHVMEMCRHDIAEKQLDVQLDLAATGHILRADSARMQQVFWNLLKNAIKFTPEGGRIYVRTRNEGARFIAEVADTGIGIDSEILPVIFNAFEQGDQAITRQFGGLGLGLAISKLLVDMHGGELTANSPGKNLGATFTIELNAQGAAPSATAAPPAAGAAVGTRILLVDDHIETSKVMKLMLERRGYIVSTAHNVKTAREALASQTFDVLISDIGLPDGNGTELVSTSTGILPAIALSGFGMDEDRKRSIEAGFKEHLVKPVSFQALQEAIARVLQTA